MQTIPRIDIRMAIRSEFLGPRAASIQRPTKPPRTARMDRRIP
jgi:hypothetical protein